jgi:hypothetical protein
MGGYCHSHGFHPVGANHDSKHCNWKTGEHNVDATWKNGIGGSTYWPAAIRVTIEQQDHVLWRGEVSANQLTGAREGE